MKLLIVDKFFEDMQFLNVVNEIKKLRFYELKEFNFKFKDSQSWPGKRTEILPKVNLSLSKKITDQFILKTKSFLEPGDMDIQMYAHIRNKKDGKKDWIHWDADISTYTGLIYLSKSNLKSGTYFYNAKKQMIGDVKFVQNRLLIFDSRYLHKAYGHHDGRLNLLLGVKYATN
jgi:hypothetical protein|tara:strand:- start:4463 stop:4981 length:519 start_codon:yes stop_codon:yes gene_type:complete